MANRIALELVADANPLVKGLDDAQRSVDKFVGSASSVSKHLDTATSGLSTMGMGLVEVGGKLTATATALGAMGLAASKEFGSFAEKVGMLSEKIGVSQETIQVWEFALHRVGMTADDLLPGFKKLSQLTTAAFGGDSKSLDKLDKIGVSIEQLKGKNPEQIFLTLAGAIAKIEDPLVRNAELQAIFGKAGINLVPILGDVKDGFANAAVQAKALGVVFNSDALTSAQQLDDKFDDLGSTMAAFSRTMASTFSGPLKDVIDMVTKAVGAFNLWWQSLDDGTKKTITIFAVAFAASGPIVATIGAFMVAVAAGFGPLLAGGAIVAGLVASIGAIAANFTTLKKSVVDTVTSLVEGVKQWLSDKLMAVVAPVQKFADGVLNIFKKLRYEVVGGSEVPDMVEEIGDHMRMLDKRMTAPARVAAAGTWQVFRELASNMENTSQQIANTTMSVWTSAASTMSGALATQILHGNDWKATMESLAQTTLSSFINLGIQLVTQKGIQAAAWAAQNGMILAGEAATATGVVGIWEGASAGIIGTFGVLTGAITGFFTATLLPFFAAIGEALMTFLSAIAAAASSTIFGIPYGIAILAGVAIIGAAIGSLMAFAFADGGIATGPTMGLIGEAGSSEAVIPLNKRGAAFMRDALGGGGSGGGPTTVVVELDGRVLAKSVYDNMPSLLRTRVRA
jgi:hypothetical protein